MKQYAIGLDNGGTMTKAALFDLSGTELCVAARKTPVCSPQPGYSERDMESLWQANCACIREILERSAISPEDVLGIAVCGHGKGLLGRYVNRGGRYLQNRGFRPAALPGWHLPQRRECSCLL